MNLPELGSVKALWRYPFKSMLGEKLQNARVTERGFEHDRVFALREKATHKLATARQYPQLLRHRAMVSGASGKVEIEMPDGSIRLADEPGIDEYFSEHLSRAVALESAWVDRTPDGLFDDSQIHIVSLQTLNFLMLEKGDSNFDPRRFRPNIVVDASGDAPQPEQSWIGKRLLIGSEVVVEIQKPCERCVMTTMAQEELRKDNEILRTVVQASNSIVGVYGIVVRGGSISVSDRVTIAL